MAFNTRVVKIIPIDQPYDYADRRLPIHPVQGGNRSSFSSFAARGPSGVVQVYIGWQGVLWREGNSRIDSGDGQIAVCQRGTEARWISINALQQHRLSVLRNYVYTHRMLHVASHLCYLQTRLKLLEAQLGTDIIAIKAGVYDACFADELCEMIVSITERMTFLRKTEESVGHEASSNSWVSCYRLDGFIDEYCYKRDKWLEMQARPEPQLEPQPEPTATPIQEPVYESAIS